jgi:hypothetical protein
MGKRKPTGRFFVFLTLFLCGIVYLITQLTGEKKQDYAMVVSGSTNNTRMMQAVIMRNETVASMDSNSTMVFAAQEGEYVNAGDEVAYIYSAGYSTKEMQKLETVRQDIRVYHTAILSNIVDAELDRRNEDVHYLAKQMKLLVNGESSGSLLNLELQLTQAMVARQEYLRQNRREDTKLNSLYEEEEKRETTVSSWQKALTAPTSGVVSFYLDGYEMYLSPDNLSNVTIEGVKGVLGGATVSNSSRLTSNVYRIVNPSRWHVLLLGNDSSFNPVTGQSFWMQMEGFEDVVYQMTVQEVLKSGSETMCIMYTDNPIGPLINQRSGRAVVSAELSGLYVPVRALRTENNLTGVYIYDGADGAFVPVQVISQDGDRVLVRPTVEGTLVEGHYVILK